MRLHAAFRPAVSRLPCLIMKPVPDLPIVLARGEIVRSAESQAVVQQESPVGSLERRNGNPPALAVALPQRKIDGDVTGETRGTAVVRKAGSVVQVSRDPAPVRQIHVSTHAQGMPLIVVQQEE